MKQKMNALVRAMVCALVCALLISTAAFAADPIDLDLECGVSIHYVYEGAPVSDAQFGLYRVGELSEDGKLSLSGDYEKYPVIVDGLTDEEFQAAADTLYGYIQLDGIEPGWEMTTDGEGKANTFGLDSGLYLLVGAPRVDEETTYITRPMLLTLPTNRTHDGEWYYYVTVSPKCSAEPTYTALKVLKVWEDKGHENARPANVTIKLLKDGELYETVQLSADNQWRYTWEQLAAGASWTVVEEINADYTVKIEQNGVTFVVTNTYVAPPPTPTPTPTPPSIPQTGLTWWPVPVLLLVGAALVAVGLLGRKEHGDEA